MSKHFTGARVAFVREPDGRWHDDDRKIFEVRLKGARESNQILFVAQDGKEIAEAWYQRGGRGLTSDDSARYPQNPIDTVYVWHFAKADGARMVPGLGLLADVLIDFVAAYEADLPRHIAGHHLRNNVGEVCFDGKNWHMS